jgi:serine/threonine-protein kinase
MGAVYRARDPRLGRDVALKVADERFSDRSSIEAKAIAALNHPNICTLHDVGSNYLVMELLEGLTLAERIAKGPLSIGEVLDLASQMARAVEEAHRRGVLHRDLKPGNVVLSQRRGSSDPPMVKVLDFGLAKLVVADPEITRTAAGTLLGTPAYMAPEQVEGKPLDERSDIFSFGAVLYEMASGHRAFAGSTVIEVMNAVVRTDPDPFQASPALDRIMRRCLQKDPAQRFQTMAEVRAALDTARDSAPPKLADTQPSIAVLPFADMSAGQDHEWFSDGLSEEIINALVHVPGLTVIARTSAFAFKGKQEDIRRIAEILGVSFILEGSVRRAGDRVRVTAQLIKAATGTHLWSERYDRDMADVFAIQDEIAHAIVTALELKLVGQPIPPRYTPTLPAYEAYLKARHHWAKATPESLARSKEYFEQAIAADAGFALAHTGLADYFLTLAGGVGVLAAHEAMPAARAAAQKALDIDPSLADAHAVLGAVSGVYDYNWKEAEREFQLAFAREPIQPSVRARYGYFYLVPIGRSLEAVEQLERALQDDPLNTVFGSVSAMSLGAARRDAEATARCRRVLEVDANDWVAYSLLALTQDAQGMPADALASAEKAYSLAPWSAVSMGRYAGLLASRGNSSRAEDVSNKLRHAPESYTAPRGLSAFYFHQGDIDQAADWMEKSIEQRDAMAPYYARRYFRSSSHWPRLAKLMNLPAFP